MTARGADGQRSGSGNSDPAESGGRELLLAVDIGSTLVKVALIRVADGAIIAAGKTTLPVERTGERAELKAEALWAAFVSAVQAVHRQTADVAARLEAVSVTSQMAGLVLLDERFRPVRGMIPGVDSRGAAYVEAFAERLQEPLVYARTGCPPIGIYPSVKLIGLRAEEPDALRRTRFIGGVKEYVVQRLTGRWVTDPATASCTQLYDQRSGDWWPEAIAAIGIKSGMLPTLLAPEETAGSLMAPAARELGLFEGMPVLVGTGDGPAANLSTGAITSAELCVSFGTTAVTRYFSEENPAFEVAPAAEEGTEAAMRRRTFRQHFGGRLFLHGCRLEGAGPALEPLLPAFADETAPLPARTMGDGALQFDPYAEEEANRFVGGGESVGRGERLRAVQDGILLALHRGMAPALAGRGFRDIRPIGGGMANRPWMQDMADLFQLPVVLTQGGDGTLGAAMIALKGLGVVPTWRHAAERIVRLTGVLEPNVAVRDDWRRCAERFRLLQERRGRA
ncbi:xylulokinase [Paenibacillus cymbidii]|uniref:xylulokinase n=1 Tax=Paenibacillus cymbidii TaxID=1639034 RepID=UPI00108144E2|nr:FGGY-family carbohydrate kinase [Paenibacillus cymbidii]